MKFVFVPSEGMKLRYNLVFCASEQGRSKFYTNFLLTTFFEFQLNIISNSSQDMYCPKMYA